MNSKFLEAIKTASREFQEFIDQAPPAGAKVVETRAAVRGLVRLDLRLKHIGSCLSAGSGSAMDAPEYTDEVRKYRETLRSLRNILETLQSSLLAEKRRLDSARANMQAARAWAASVREMS